MSEVSSEAVEARREYMREWKRNNPDKVRESNRKYWEKYALRKRTKSAAGQEDVNHAD